MTLLIHVHMEFRRVLFRSHIDLFIMSLSISKSFIISVSFMFVSLQTRRDSTLNKQNTETN